MQPPTDETFGRGSQSQSSAKFPHSTGNDPPCARNKSVAGTLKWAVFPGVQIDGQVPHHSSDDGCCHSDSCCLDGRRGMGPARQEGRRRRPGQSARGGARAAGTNGAPCAHGPNGTPRAHGAACTGAHGATCAGPNGAASAANRTTGSSRACSRDRSSGAVCASFVFAASSCRSSAARSAHRSAAAPRYTAHRDAEPTRCHDTRRAARAASVATAGADSIIARREQAGREPSSGASRAIAVATWSSEPRRAA